MHRGSLGMSNTPSSDVFTPRQVDSSPAGQLNRVVWILWLQGFENAPEVVRFCLHTWKARNPTWQVVELTDGNLADYIDPDSLSVLRSLTIERQKFANLIRLYLISRHGGVWTDASNYCCRPLDDWLPRHMASGFFAFRNPGPGRILSNWFLSAVKGNVLTSLVFEQHRDFFVKNRFAMRTAADRARARRLSYILDRSATFAQLWTYPLITRTMKTYPYYIFHYHFARIVRENAECRQIWNRTPSVSALGPLKMSRAGLGSPMTTQLIEDLEHLKDPLYKLKWKEGEQELPGGCILDHLMHSVD